MDNNQTGAGFSVCGIFRTNNDMFEGMSVFVPAGELRALTGMEEGSWHRLIARLDNNDLTDKVTGQAREALPGYEVLNWKEISPDLAMIADFMGQIYGVFMAIILAALAFGIVNTMLMAVLERTRELGMLAAIGMNEEKDLQHDNVRINLPVYCRRICRNGHRRSSNCSHAEKRHKPDEIL